MLVRAGLLIVLLTGAIGPLRAQPLPALIPYNAGGLWGYADTLGRVRIPPRWLNAQLFNGGNAVVSVSGRPGQRAPSALIDTLGGYIIGPETGWNGSWGGSWGTTELNTWDSAGRMGLVELNGHVSIKPEWTSGLRMQGQLADSFRIVYRDGLAGIVDREGRIVTPVKWGGIESNEALARIRAFQVVDPDNTAGNNNTGIADLSGRLLIPPRYAGVQLKRSPAGKLFFEASRAASNERAPGNGSAIYAAPKFFDYPSCRQIPDPGGTLAVDPDRGIPLPGGYFQQGQKVVDSAGKVVVPCCRFLRLTGDTLVLRDKRHAGRDSLLVRIEYVHVKTRKPLAPTRRLLLYVDDELQKQLGEQPFSYRFRSYSDNPPPPAITIPDYGAVEKFYKDSFFFSIIKPADALQQAFIVHGEVPWGGWRSTKMAVVDSGFHYLMLPREGRDIIAYNSREQLATIQRYTAATKIQEQSLVTPDFAERELFRLRRGEVLAAYRWNGRVFALIHVQDECDASPAGARYYVTDSSGIPLAAFQPYRFVVTAPNQPERDPGIIRVTDSAGLTGLLRPDGSPVFPALNFRYRYLERTVNGWFLAGVNDASGKLLLDTAGRSLLPNPMLVYRIDVVDQSSQRYYRSWEPLAPVSGLYGLSVQDAGKGNLFMYIDRHGRLYYSE